MSITYGDGILYVFTGQRLTPKDNIHTNLGTNTYVDTKYANTGNPLPSQLTPNLEYNTPLLTTTRSNTHQKMKEYT